MLPFVASTMAVAMAADLPVREVVLYKSGVGYFERGGRLAPGESAKLDFKADEMNDVLKSLTVADSAGKVVALRYDASEPLAEKLSDFPFSIGGAQSLSGFLDQLKGARIELKYGPENVSGTIVSARHVAATDKTPEREEVVLMLDSGDLRVLDLAAAGSLRFADPKLQVALKDYLAAVAQARSKDKRSVYIDSSDAGNRQISAAYMVPMPVWKSSYRLIFSDQGQPTLEGWAIVDNTTSDDWTNVRLAVVSGRPVSFISKLYEPKYVERETVDLAESQPVAPVVYQGALGGVASKVAPPPAPAAPRPMMRNMAPRGAAQYEMSDQATSSVQVNTEGREIGELFEYRFSTPVTIKRGESAMLPFVQQKIDARKLLVYSENYGQNPMSAAELTNSTGKALDGGPITVFEGNSYSGEALVQTMKAGDKRLISYALDLGTRVTTKFDSGDQVVREIHVRRGLLTTRFSVRETKTYSIRNIDQKPKTLIVEQPVRPEYKLVGIKPLETTASAYRFEVKLPPDSTEKFPVTEERVFDETTALTNLTPDALFSLVQNKAMSEAARQALRQIADQKRQIAALQQQENAAEAEIRDLSNDQQRMRQNIQSLNSVSGQQDQVQQYARQLASQEAQIAALRDRAGQLKKQRATLESNLNSMIEKLEF
jgi:cell division protein FtsB